MMEHYSQSYLKKEAIPDFLLKELCLPVQWEATYLALRKAGITSWQEVGTGDSLMKYNRWIAGEQR
jgi:malonyl CoA-acyl carrier protein transacylase